MFNRLDTSVAFPSLFSTLWYATLPCFDVEGVTAEKEGQRAILRFCSWKGETKLVSVRLGNVIRY